MGILWGSRICSWICLKPTQRLLVVDDPTKAGVCIAQNGPGITNFVTGNYFDG
jgi:hypothetical protein